MNIAEFIGSALNGLNRSLMRDLQGLSPEHLAYRPASGANSIGYLAWHLLHSQDNVVQGRLQGKPSLWVAEGWHQRLGMAPETPAAAEAAHQSAYPMDQLLEYADRVNQASQEWASRVGETELSRITDPQNPNSSVSWTLQFVVLGHGWWHLGEIRYLKGLQGMPQPF